MPFYDNEKNNAAKIIDSFLDYGWTCLIAQMQSAKTNSYLLTIFYMFKDGKIEHCKIICGASDKELEEQLKNDFDNSLFEFLMMFPEEGIELKNKIKNNTKILFSSDLDLKKTKNKKHKKIEEKTLYVWEESHFAQNKNNRPNKFLCDIGINANGDISILEEKKIYVLSVSATPFSEFSDVKHKNQNKKIIYGETGELYKSVEYYLNNNKIRKYENPLEAINQALKNHNSIHKKKPMYALCRLMDSNKDSDEIKKKFEEKGWNIYYYNSKKKDIENLDQLKTKPKKNTLIILSAMCRMGKKLPIEHISFLIEFSKNPNTDTILQSFLGRMCGYHSNTDVLIYLHKNVVESEDLNRYVKFYKKEDIMPKKAKNLKTEKTNPSTWNYLKIQKVCPEYLNTFSSDRTRECLIEIIKKAVEDDKIINHNCIEQHEDIKKQLLDISKDENNIMNTRSLSSKYNTYREVPERISNSFNEKEISTVHSCHGCGFDKTLENINYINIWNVDEDYPEFDLKKGDIFIDMRTKILSSDMKYEKNVSKTTGNEAFDGNKIHEEDGSTHRSNGSYTHYFPEESAWNEDVMYSELSQCIELSIDPKYPSHNKNYIKTEKNEKNEFGRILVNEEIYNSLKKNGKIYKTILEKYNLKLTFNECSGDIAKKIKNAGFIGLTRISWN
jgi:hypothetical protein